MLSFWRPFIVAKMDYAGPKQPFAGETIDDYELHQVAVTPGREEEKKGTDCDQHDMIRMGKRQETRVR